MVTKANLRRVRFVFKEVEKTARIDKVIVFITSFAGIEFCQGLCRVLPVNFGGL